MNLLILLALMAFNTADLQGEVQLSVTNPSNTRRVNDPVIVEWSKIPQHFTPDRLELRDETGSPLPVQVDDLDLDGTPDELTFVADFAPGQARVFTLVVSDRQIKWPARTDAQNYKRVAMDGESSRVLRSIDDDDNPGTGRERRAYRFDGVGWESEIIGYRLYLDERNATDIQGKRKPGLYWNWIGESGVDYQLDADWGMDVLHVGPALGVGGIGLWVGDSVVKPLVLDRQRTRIVARGPVRAVVRVEYTGWEMGSRKIDLTSLFSIYAGERVSTHRILFQSGGEAIIATGIVKHDSALVFWDPDNGCLHTAGRQARAGDGLVMALTVGPERVITKTEDANNQLLLLNAMEGKPLDILISSYWDGETGRSWSDDEKKTFLQATTRRLKEPLRVSIR